MKINSMFYVSVFFTAVMIFGMPLGMRAQEYSVVNKPYPMLNRMPRQFSMNGCGIFAGCFFNFGGYFVAQTYYAPVPAVALLGHPPEYVAFYTDAYRAKSKELRSSAAFMGCIHGAVVQACLPVTIALFARQ